MEKIDSELLEKIAELHSIPEGSFNIRKNGKRLMGNSTDEIEIRPKTDKDGIDVIVRAGVKNKSVHIPVILTQGDFHDTAYNDFYIGEDADVTIVAGCGIHNPKDGTAEHDGIHTFHMAKNSRARYIERHYAKGGQASKQIFDPVTTVYMDENSVLEMETTQIGGVTFTDRSRARRRRQTARQRKAVHRKRRKSNLPFPRGAERQKQHGGHSEPKRRTRQVVARVLLRPRGRKRMFRTRGMRRHTA